MSGAKSECFAGSPKNVQGWNVERYNDAYVSSDEYPFEGVSEGGTGDPNNNYTPQTQWAVIMGNTHDGQSRTTTLTFPFFVTVLQDVLLTSS